MWEDSKLVSRTAIVSRETFKGQRVNTCISASVISLKKDKSFFSSVDGVFLTLNRWDQKQAPTANLLPLPKLLLFIPGN